MLVDGTWRIPCYCMACGKQHGYCSESVTERNGDYVGYLCDSCAEDPKNAIVGTMVLPDHEHWQRVREAQLEEHGRALSLSELVRVFDDGTSPLARLLRNR